MNLSNAVFYPLPVPTYRSLASGFLATALSCAFLLSIPNNASADTTLRGEIGARTIDDDVVIARGTKCVLNGTKIKGNVRVLGGATLSTVRAEIIGNVQAFDSRKVDLRKFSKINGDVQGEGTRSIIVRENTLVGGNVQLKEANAPSGVDALLVDNAIVKGDVQAEKGGGRLRVLGTRIDGNLQFVENSRGPYMVQNNRVDGDLQFFKNRGTGRITGNRVDGNLQSKENSPRPTVSNNKVEGEVELE